MKQLFLHYVIVNLDFYEEKLLLAMLTLIYMQMCILSEFSIASLPLRFIKSVIHSIVWQPFMCLCHITFCCVVILLYSLRSLCKPAFHQLVFMKMFVGYSKNNYRANPLQVTLLLTFHNCFKQKPCSD